MAAPAESLDDGSAQLDGEGRLRSRVGTGDGVAWAVGPHCVRTWGIGYYYKTWFLWLDG